MAICVAILGLMFGLVAVIKNWAMHADILWTSDDPEFTIIHEKCTQLPDPSCPLVYQQERVITGCRCQ